MRMLHRSFDGQSIDDLTLVADVETGTRAILIGVRGWSVGEVQPRSALVQYELAAEGRKVLPAGEFSQTPRAGTYFYLNHEEQRGSASGEGLGPRTEARSGDQITVQVVHVPADATTVTLRGANWRRAADVHVDEVWVSRVPDDGLRDVELDKLPDWLRSSVPTGLLSTWAARHHDVGPSEPGNDDSQRLWAVSREILPAPQGLGSVAAAHAPSVPPASNRIRVALVCDEFTYNSFSPEFESIALEPQRWRDQIEEFKPDLFFCESAWSGVDSVARPWRGRVYGSVKFQGENRSDLLAILAHCKKSSIPTIFWNKEDPTHFFDRVNDFVSTAARFDYVFTTAEEMLPEYKKFMAPGRVGVLQFAAQHRDFNPISRGPRENKAVFAGAWYRVHEERSAVMREGFEYVLRAGTALEIYDRNFTSESADFRFPDEYRELRRPSITHAQTAGAYKTSRFGLNFNTVVSSATMFARRVFELAATQTQIVSNYSPGIERIYGDDVIYFDRGARELSEYSDGEISRQVLRAAKTTLSKHTYRHRFEEVLSFIGLPHSPARPAPTMMVRVATTDQAEWAIAALSRAGATYSHLLLLVDRRVPSIEVGQFYNRYSSRLVSVLSERFALTERVPSTNFVTTPDVIPVALNDPPTAAAVATMQMHSQYTHFPVTLTAGVEPRWQAVPLENNMLIPANSVLDFLVSTEPTTVLGVPRD